MRCIVNTKLSSVVCSNTDQLLFPRTLGYFNVDPCRLGRGAFVIDAQGHKYIFGVSTYVCLACVQVVPGVSLCTVIRYFRLLLLHMAGLWT